MAGQTSVLTHAQPPQSPALSSIQPNTGWHANRNQLRLTNNTPFSSAFARSLASARRTWESNTIEKLVV